MNLAEEDKFNIRRWGQIFPFDKYDLSDLNPVSVSLFVLNTNFIVWFNRNNVGIEIAYPAIIFHGLNEDSIYLNIEDNQIIGTYITIRCNPELQNNQNPLFNIIDSKITNVYEAISYVLNYTQFPQMMIMMKVKLLVFRHWKYHIQTRN